MWGQSPKEAGDIGDEILIEDYKGGASSAQLYTHPGAFPPYEKLITATFNISSWRQMR